MTVGPIAANRRRVSGGGFTPASLSPLIWFDSDDAPSSGGNLTTGWPDLSGNGYNTTYVSPTPPTVVNNVLNGHKVVQVQSGQQTVVQSWSHAIKELWVVCNYDQSLPQSVGYPRLVQGDGGMPYLFLVNTTSNLSADDTPYEFYPANPQTQNGYFMGYAATNSPGSNSEFLVTSSSGWSGRLAFICGFSNQLSSGNRTNMFTYLSSRYSISYP